jgi:ATP-dependent RNA helicase DDX49/DBP8
MPSVSVKGRRKKAVVERAEEIVGDSDSGASSASGPPSGPPSEEASEEASEDASEVENDSNDDSHDSHDNHESAAEDSDSLDSASPRKRRRTSPPASDDEKPNIIKSAFNVPSRIKLKPQAETNAGVTPQPSGPEPAPRVTAPLDVNTTFESLGLRPWLVQSLANMAIKRPTAIQRESIPMLLKGRDCIGGSRTGSGKTVAFSVPIFQKWAENPSAIFAVILTPTR